MQYVRPLFPPLSQIKYIFPLDISKNRGLLTPSPPITKFSLLRNILRIQFFVYIVEIIRIRKSVDIHSSTLTTFQVNTPIYKNIRLTGCLTCPNNHYLPRTKRLLKSFKYCLFWRDKVRSEASCGKC